VCIVQLAQEEHISRRGNNFNLSGVFVCPSEKLRGLGYQRLFNFCPGGVEIIILEGFVSRLTVHEIVSYSRKALSSQFILHDFFEPAFYPVSLFYLGILTLKDEFA